MTGAISFDIRSCDGFVMNAGESLIPRRAASAHNRAMNSHKQPYIPIRQRESLRVEELKKQIDERDEVIRQLNEALSLALDELTAPERAA